MAPLFLVTTSLMPTSSRLRVGQVQQVKMPNSAWLQHPKSRPGHNNVDEAHSFPAAILQYQLLHKVTIRTRVMLPRSNTNYLSIYRLQMGHSFL